ncbi:hypothetical protein [Antrihabitans sp. YC2-6]|uniref:hypothetical protein n=1 Tax=Antrihabitans sp. YC2-6 TaxID=2799498 RepID=UPI0018F47610|nr:hypothetical protein [Antrihabitans sp. YC2-6]MBJ8347711.1 hypothetical protein [Antrihabitans sp. YC2-6]
MPTSRRLRIVTCAVAAAATVAVAFPGGAVAEPTVPTPLIHAIEKLAASPVPDAVAITAARLIAQIRPAATAAARDLIRLGTVDAAASPLDGLSSPVDVASPADLLGAYQTAVGALRALGVNPFFYPTAAPFCSEGGAPLGLAPAVAGTVPGPWPGVNILGQDFNAVKPGETMFAFVPAGVAPGGTDSSGMQVAWFNINTLKGGFVPMGSISEVASKAIPAGLPVEAKAIAEAAVAQFLTAAIPLGGVRAVPVETGKGTVLAAIFGTVQNGENSCFFFPTVGLTSVK